MYQKTYHTELIVLKAVKIFYTLAQVTIKASSNSQFSLRKHYSSSLSSYLTPGTMNPDHQWKSRPFVYFFYFVILRTPYGIHYFLPE